MILYFGYSIVQAREAAIQTYLQMLILQAGGSAALEALLRKEADDALPEFLKPRPKYFYYYKWMRQRVLQHCGELPGPVMDKLLTLDATELDMLLTYPSGIKQQVRSLGARAGCPPISHNLTWLTVPRQHLLVIASGKQAHPVEWLGIPHVQSSALLLRQ